MATAPPDPVSLAAAQKRARKAAALAKPEFRSHAEGLVLSPAAAEAVAACRGERCDLLTLFLLAVEETRRLVETGGCAVQHCPDALGIGERPLPITSPALGNRCEPLYNRGALEVVRQLLQPDWRGLEWFTGGSTSWFLARLAHLTSIETAPGGCWRCRGALFAGWLLCLVVSREHACMVGPAWLRSLISLHGNSRSAWQPAAACASWFGVCSAARLRCLLPSFPWLCPRLVRWRLDPAISRPSAHPSPPSPAPRYPCRLCGQGAQRGRGAV